MYVQTLFCFRYYSKQALPIICLHVSPLEREQPNRRTSTRDLPAQVPGVCEQHVVGGAKCAQPYLEYFTVHEI